MSQLPDKISLVAFREAFAKQWETEISENPEEIKERFSLTKEWTSFMQEGGGFLEKIMARLKSQDQLTYKIEDCKIDAMYVGGKGQFGLSNSAYPPALCAMIEHENGDHPEEEMWKLTFWRSPLKVIVFYDYSMDECASNQEKANWLQEKLDLFKAILMDANKFFPENESTNYLFLIGAWKKRNESIYWRWASNEYWKPQPLID